MNLNPLTIIGYIERNAEIKHPSSGTEKAKFLAATSRSWKDSQGERQEKIQWHRVLAFGHGLPQIAPPLLKGIRAFVQGELAPTEGDIPLNRGMSIQAGSVISLLWIIALDSDMQSNAPVRSSLRAPAFPPR